MAKVVSKEYAVLGRFRKDSKFSTLATRSEDMSKLTDRKEAERIMEGLRAKAERDIRKKSRPSTQIGMISVSTPYYSDYDVVEFRIVEREVSAWEIVSQVDTIVSED